MSCFAIGKFIVQKLALNIVFRFDRYQCISPQPITHSIKGKRFFYDHIVAIIQQFKIFTVIKIIAGHGRNYILIVPEQHLLCPKNRLGNNIYSIVFFFQ